MAHPSSKEKRPSPKNSLIFYIEIERRGPTFLMCPFRPLVLNKKVCFIIVCLTFLSELYIGPSMVFVYIILNLILGIVLGYFTAFPSLKTRGALLVQDKKAILFYLFLLPVLVKFFNFLTADMRKMNVIFFLELNIQINNNKILSQLFAFSRKVS